MRAFLLPAAVLCLCACPSRESPTPVPRERVGSTSERPQQQAPTKAETSPELVDVQLRTDRTRMGEAVRLHVTAWRDSSGPSFSPTVQLLGPAKATAQRVGDEIIEEQDGRVRERVDILIEPGEVGRVGISVVVATASGEQLEQLTLEVDEPLSAAELNKQLATQAGRLARGRALAKQGDYKRAIEAFNLALEQQRDDPLVLGEVGWAAFLAGDLSLARRATREALRHQTEPKSRGALLYNLGRIAEALGRADEAIAAYRRSLAVRPDSEPTRMRLTRLAAANPAPTCIGPGCPLTPPVDGKRACELVEEEGCPLFHQRGACSCDAEALLELDAIGPWQLLTLTERDPEAGRRHLYFLLADAAAELDQPRYHVFAPLPGSLAGSQPGQRRAGVRAAELIETGELKLLRIDFEGSIEPSPAPDSADTEPEALARGWTLLCGFVDVDRPVCAPPLLTRFHTPQNRFEAPLTLADDGNVSQTIESGTAPSRSELDAAFPGARMQVVTRPMSIASMLAHAG